MYTEEQIRDSLQYALRRIEQDRLLVLPDLSVRRARTTPEGHVRSLVETFAMDLFGGEPLASADVSLLCGWRG